MNVPGPADIIGIAMTLGIVLFWLWAITDSARHQRYGWTAAAALLPVVGSLLYFVLGRKQQPSEFLQP